MELRLGWVNVLVSTVLASIVVACAPGTDMQDPKGGPVPVGKLEGFTYDLSEVRSGGTTTPFDVGVLTMKIENGKISGSGACGKYEVKAAWNEVLETVYITNPDPCWDDPIPLRLKNFFKIENDGRTIKISPEDVAWVAKFVRH